MNTLDSMPLFHLHEGREALSIIVDPKSVPSFLGRSARRLSTILRPRDKRDPSASHPGHEPASSLFTRLRAAIRHMARRDVLPASGLFVTAGKVHEFPMTRYFAQTAARFPWRAHRAFIAAVNCKPALRVVELRRKGVVLHEICGETLTTLAAWPSDRNGIVSPRAASDLIAFLLGPASCSYVVCGPSALLAMVAPLTFARGAREFVEIDFECDANALVERLRFSRRALETSHQKVGIEIHRAAMNGNLLVYENERIRHMLERQRGDTLFVSSPGRDDVDVLATAQAKGVDVYFLPVEARVPWRGFGLVANAS